MDTPKHTPTTKELRQFGLIMGAFIAGIFGLLLPWIWGFGFVLWPWIVAGIFWAWALIAPATLTLAYHPWMKLAVVLAWVNTRLILGIVFFLIFFPMSLILRLIGWDAMARKLKTKSTTYRVPSKHAERESMERPF